MVYRKTELTLVSFSTYAVSRLIELVYTYRMVTKAVDNVIFGLQ
jgi:hypothetical protein